MCIGPAGGSGNQILNGPRLAAIGTAGVVDIQRGNPQGREKPNDAIGWHRMPSCDFDVDRLFTTVTSPFLWNPTNSESNRTLTNISDQTPLHFALHGVILGEVIQICNNVL